MDILHAAGVPLEAWQLLQGAAKELKAGDPADISTNVGPVLLVVRWTGESGDVIVQINALG